MIQKKVIELAGLGGLTDRFWGDYESLTATNHNMRILGKPNQYAFGFVNPYARLGYLCPATQTEQLTTDTVGGIISTISDSNYNSYYTMDTAGQIRTVYEGGVDEIFSFSATGGAYAVDMVIYMVNGTRKVFYSYDNDVGIWNGSSSTVFTSAFLSVVPVNAFTPNHAVKMIVSGKYLYMLDQNVVHRFDGTVAGGTNGTAYQNILEFAESSYLRDVIENRDKLWIAVENEDSVGVYIWNKQTTVLTSSAYIPIPTINHIIKLFMIGTNVYCFAYSARGTVIMKYDGVTFEVVKEIGGEDTLPNFKHSIAYVGNSIYWIGYKNGYLYRFGEVIPGEKDALYVVANLGYNKTGINGFYAIHYTNKLYNDTVDSKDDIITVGYYANGGNAFSKIIPNTFTNNYPLPGQYFSLVKLLPKLSTIKSITLFYPPLATGGSTVSMNLDLYFNQSTTSWGTIPFTLDDGVRSFKRILVGQKNINSIQLGINWNTANLMSNTITPSYAEIEYESTTKDF